MRQVFDTLDVDEVGHLCAASIKSVVGMDFDDSDVEAMIALKLKLAEAEATLAELGATSDRAVEPRDEESISRGGSESLPSPAPVE